MTEKRDAETTSGGGKNLEKKYCRIPERAGKKKRELEERMRLEAEAERDKKLSEAAAAEEAGNLAEAEMALAEAQMVETVAASTTVVMNTPKTKGIGTAKDWEIESIDREKVPVVFSGVEIRPVDEKQSCGLLERQREVFRFRESSIKKQ